MALSDYLESAQRGDDSELKDFARRMLRGDAIDADLVTAYDRWLYAHVITPALGMSEREIETAALIARTAAEMPPIVKGTGAMAATMAVLRASSRKET